ncbi:unnamed protein product [Albugo candida]|uniref:Protein kinase domain-containing protein n=1 Tax=Albugo candida TaxID=65357 RepID=A0A024G304_9STRA|nr:unnamed protein product [Albugo candida]|eukprot:CCI41041.1 unnamed protein product [Albugo candida]
MDRSLSERASSGSTIVYLVVGLAVFLILVLIMGCFWWCRRDKRLRHRSPREAVNYHHLIAPSVSNTPYRQLRLGTELDKSSQNSDSKVSIPADLSKPIDLSFIASSNSHDQDTVQTADFATRVLGDFQQDSTIQQRYIPYSSLYFTRVVSKGAFGEVWLAQLEDRQVAVKRMLAERKNDEKEIECFAAEIKLMASFSHPKIVEFVGLSWINVQDLCAVTEYMPRGDLFDHLKKKQGQLRWYDQKLYLAEDIAEALSYLHSLQPKVIHRDLKSKNVLLDHQFRAKLSDFGISRERELEETMTAGVGTVYWIAPEVLLGRKYTEKADIYSFGVVMSELDTHHLPYSDHKDGAGRRVTPVKIARAVAQLGLRPTFSRACPQKVRLLAMRCLDANPDRRPPADELVQLLQQLQVLKE